MIEFNQIFCEDFEEAGRHERNFELDEFIQKDLSRAFGYLDWRKCGFLLGRLYGI